MRVALMAIFCLLAQQVALAAYLCPVDSTRVEMSAVAGGCVGMNMAHVQSDLGLCAKHCHPDQTAATDAAKLSVPPLALPSPMYFASGLQPLSPIATCNDVPIARSDPPPRLQYCSLLI
jgi:hypothetical protein